MVSIVLPNTILYSLYYIKSSRFSDIKKCLNYLFACVVSSIVSLMFIRPITVFCKGKYYRSIYRSNLIKGKNHSSVKIVGARKRRS